MSPFRVFQFCISLQNCTQHLLCLDKRRSVALKDPSAACPSEFSDCKTPYLAAGQSISPTHINLISHLPHALFSFWGSPCTQPLEGLLQEGIECNLSKCCLNTAPYILLPPSDQILFLDPPWNPSNSLPSCKKGSYKI